MLRGVWEALNCVFIHATFCVIATGASPGQTKNEGLVMVTLCYGALEIVGLLLLLLLLKAGVRKNVTCCEACCKHGNVFLTMQNLAQLAEQRLQWKEKRG